MAGIGSFLNSLLRPKPQPQPRLVSPVPAPPRGSGAVSTTPSGGRVYPRGFVGPVRPQDHVIGSPRGGSVLGSQAPQPQSFGQSPGGGGGGGGGGNIDLSAPVFDQGPNQEDVLNQLRGVYGQARSDIEAQNPILEQSYGLAKGDIDASIKQNEEAATRQRSDVDLQFGDLLRNQLRTYQDLNRQRQGTFSGLGTLDSSAFAEQQFKADQDFGQQRARTDTERVKTVSSIDSQLNAYKQKATSELSRLALQYQQGKNSIASAIASNRLDEAGAIQDAINQIRSRAAEIQNSIINFANQAQLLKAQGVDVRTGILGTNANQYAQGINQILQGMTAQGNAMYGNALLPATLQGSGFIGSGRPEDELRRRLATGTPTQ